MNFTLPKAAPAKQQMQSPERVRNGVLFEQIMENVGLDDIDLPPLEGPDGGDGGEGRVCEWDGETCMETPQYYLVMFCADHECRARHRRYLCKRHYAYMLNSMLRHLAGCECVVCAVTDDERATAVAAHISGFGRIGE